MKRNEGACLPLICKKRKPDVFYEQRDSQCDVGILKTCFRTARFNGSVPNHRAVMNRGAQVKAQKLRNNAVADHSGGGLNIAVHVENLSDFCLSPRFPTLVAQRGC